MSNEFELDFRMPNNEKPLFVCWQCVIAENIEPSKFGEFWFNPVTGTKNKGLAYYPSNLRKINKAPQNHLYGSLLWKPTNHVLNLYKEKYLKDTSYTELMSFLSEEWLTLWVDKKYHNIFSNMKINPNNNMMKNIPYDSEHMNHFMFLDELCLPIDNNDVLKIDYTNPFRAV